MKKIVFCVLALGLFPTGNLFAQTTPPAGPAHKGLVGLSGWVVFWDAGNGSLRDFALHAASVDRVYLDAYRCGQDGMPTAIPEATDALKKYAVAAAKQGQCQPWILISGWGNPSRKETLHTGLQKMLHDGAMRKQHIDALVASALKDQVAGIQVHYGSLGGRDRGALVAYMGELSAACKAKGLLTGIVVWGKSSSGEEWWEPRSMDYAGLGGNVDVMTNVWGQRRGDDTPAGFFEDPEDTEAVIRYMTSVVSPAKVEVSCEGGGYDWLSLHRDELPLTQLDALLKQYNISPSRDTEISQQMTFDYPPNHEVWYSDAKTFEYMADIAKRSKTYGVSLWRFGLEAPEFWEMMKRVQGTPTATAAIGVPPTKPMPLRMKPVEIFTNRVREFFIWASGGRGTEDESPESNAEVIEKEGKWWANIMLKGVVWSPAGFGLARVNLKSYVKNGAMQFYIKGSKGGETFTVGFESAPGLTKEESIIYNNLIPLSNYVEVTTDWKLVTIPLADFPESGKHWDEKLQDNVTWPFNWTRLGQFFIMRGPAGDAPVEFQISNIRIVPTYSMKDLRR